MRQVFVGVVTEMSDSAPPEVGSSRPLSGTPAASRAAKVLGQFKRVRAPVADIAGLGAILSGLVGYWNVYENVRHAVVPHTSPAALAADAGPLSIVVLPFANLTGDPNQAYVVDGLTASVTSDLSRIRDAFVVGAATAMAYKDKPVTAQQVGKDLGVHYVLQGGVQRDGTRIRINVQLADSDDNAQLWAESFEGDLSNLFALQDQVTTRIGNSLGREMVILAARPSETRKSSTQFASLLLRARALYTKPRSLKTYQEIEDLYRQALALEPDNAAAMAGLAHTLVVQPNNFGSQMEASVRERKYEEGRALALKAKELDPSIPDVYNAIGLYAADHGDFGGAQRAFETWLSLEPKRPNAYNNLGNLYYRAGQPEKAIEILTQGINLDPKGAYDLILQNLGRSYFMLGDNDAAIAWLLKSSEKNPKLSNPVAFLAMAYALIGEDDKARATASEFLRMDPGSTLSARRRGAASESPAFREWFEAKFVPAWRKAGLPE